MVGALSGRILTLTALDGAHRPLHVPLPPSPFKETLRNSRSRVQRAWEASLR